MLSQLVVVAFIVLTSDWWLPNEFGRNDYYRLQSTTHLLPRREEPRSRQIMRVIWER